MPDITQTARAKIRDPKSINSNVAARITSMKMVERLSDAPGKTAKAKTSGRERWHVETDGMGGIDLNIEIPSKVHHLKDRKARESAVRDLVLEAAEPKLAEELGIYAN